MKLHYYPETDSLYIELKDQPGGETREVADGVNLDLDASGDLVGFDIDNFKTLRFDEARGRRLARSGGIAERLISPRLSKRGRLPP